jgi:hypothetical protein
MRAVISAYVGIFIGIVLIWGMLRYRKYQYELMECTPSESHVHCVSVDLEKAILPCIKVIVGAIVLTAVVPPFISGFISGAARGGLETVREHTTPIT